MGFFTSPTGDGFTPDDLEDSIVPIMEAEPGTFHQLPQGVRFEQWDPAHPTTAFGDFEKSVLRGIAAGLGVSYHSLANDLTQTSYSSIRQGAIEDREFYKQLQRFMIDHFIMPIYAEWLNSAMTYGSVQIPLRRYNKFYNASMFQPRGFSWIDPLKEINAHVIALQNGLISMQDVQNNYGRDVDETFAQIARDKQLAEQYGLKMAFEPFGANTNAVDPDITGGDDELQAD
jgi:lambda family phage portal protein